MNIWAVPDIHGRFDLLSKILDKLYQRIDFKKDLLIFLGDYVDRGPDSNLVLGKLRELTKRYPKNVICLAGNHDWMMVDAYEKGPVEKRLWKANGGGKTVKSFRGRVPGEVLEWVKTLPLSYETDTFFFSHAPVPKWADPPYKKHDLIWTYNGLDAAGVYGPAEKKIGVCGHIHQLNIEVKEPRFYEDYYFLDSGCGCSVDAPLVAVECNTREVLYAHPDPQTFISDDEFFEIHKELTALS